MQPDRSGQGSVTPTEGQPGTQRMGIGCRPLPAPCWLPGARGLGGPHAGKISRQPLHWRGSLPRSHSPEAGGQSFGISIRTSIRTYL